MIRFVFRFIGIWFLAAGFVALVRDGTVAIAASGFDVGRLVKLGDDWTNIHPASLDSLKAAVEKYAGSSAVDLLTAYVLGWPTWLVLGVVGAILILIGRKQKPLIGYARD